MSSPWESAISQIMQRHGGSNRSVPKAARRAPAEEKSADTAVLPEQPQQGQDEAGPSIVPDRR